MAEWSPRWSRLDLGMLLRVDYLSLDRYMRGRMSDAKSYAAPAEIGGVMPGESVATILASSNGNYAVFSLQRCLEWA